MESNKKSKNINKAPSLQKVLISIFKASPNGVRSATLQELTVATGGVKSTVSRFLGELEDRDYVEREQSVSLSARARGFWLKKKALAWLRSNGYDTSNYVRPYLASEEIRVVPLLGEAAAGNPISPDAYIPDENVDEYVPLPAGILPIGSVFMVRVRGDSMTGDHIIHGDQVIVVPYSGEPKGNGEIILALIDGDATVKHLSIRDRKYHLEGTGPDHYERTEEPENVHIQGRVVGLFRSSREGL
jgi:SOS-response transcriptional repressor LexA